MRKRLVEVKEGQGSLNSGDSLLSFSPYIKPYTKEGWKRSPHKCENSNLYSTFFKIVIVYYNNVLGVMDYFNIMYDVTEGSSLKIYVRKVIK